MRIMGVTVALVIAIVFVFGMFYILNLIEKGKEVEVEGEQKELTRAEAVEEALKLYQEKKQEGMNFSSQCLGTVGDYAVDIVHVPRTAEDNEVKNQCEDYRKGKVSHFIELDKDGNIVRIM
jgi:hypothetical protein